MKIELHGFKCYTEFSLEIPDTSLTLLKGPSGIGKSTILQALTWVLYGQLRGVSPNSNKKGKLFVRLTLPNLCIYRQKNPGLLQVKRAGSQYEDAVAQSIINETFCLPDIWSAVSYISQGNRNSLLSSSNAEKMDLLNRLAFHNQDVDAFISKVDLAIGTAKISLDTLLPQLTREIEIFQNDFKGFTYDPSLSLTIEEVGQLERRRKEQQIELEKLRISLTFQQQQIGQLNTLKSQITLTESEISKLASIDLTDKSDEITELEKLVSLESRRQQLLIAIKQLGSTCQITATEDELKTMKAAWAIFNENLNLARTSKVEYERQAIDQAISELKEKLGKQAHLPLAKQVRDLEKRLSSIPESSVSLDDVKLAEEHLRGLERGLNVLTCPHCSGSVRYIGNSLVSENQKPASQNEVNMARSRLNLLTTQRSQEETRLSLIKQIDSLKSSLPADLVYEEPLSYLAIKGMEERLLCLQKITICPRPSLELLDIENQLRCLASSNQLRSLNEELQSLPESKGSPNELTSKLMELRRESLNAVSVRARLEHTRSMLERLVSSVSLISIDEGLEGQVKASEIELAEMDRKIQGSKMTALYLSRYRELETKRNSLTAWQARYTHLLSLKFKMIEVECSVLQSTVDSINNILTEIVNGLFDEPLTIALRLFKQNKTTERVRPVVNVAISYKGSEYEVNQLSGGEGDRVSLALTLALNRVSGSPLLLFDESMSSLDGSVREMCLQQIRDNTPGRTVLCIAHEDVEGHYDHILNLN